MVVPVQTPNGDYSACGTGLECPTAEVAIRFSFNASKTQYGNATGTLIVAVPSSPFSADQYRFVPKGTKCLDTGQHFGES